MILFLFFEEKFARIWYQRRNIPYPPDTVEPDDDVSGNSSYHENYDMEDNSCYDDNDENYDVSGTCYDDEKFDWYDDNFEFNK